MRRTRPIVACPKCHGVGRVRTGGFGTGATAFCYKCQGSGKVKGVFMDPQSVARRETARRRGAEKRAADDARERAWAEVNPRGYAWLTANADIDPFASSLLRRVRKQGELSPKQSYVLLQRTQERLR